MGKHLLDETAEFRLPTLGRHAVGDGSEGLADITAGDGDELEATQRFDVGFQRPRIVPGTHRHDDAGVR